MEFIELYGLGVKRIRMKHRERLGGARRMGMRVAATAAELMGKPIVHLFSAKLHVSRYTPRGCLRVKDEREEP